VSSAPSIRTPDERLRVFVSSTIEELADERTAVREAIERLRLSPVLFELGARPHPPQDVYQSYLERSDVFVGIYGESYGWVGPGMEISGLEDEYLRSTGKPRLLYVKAPAPARDERLAAFIERLKSDASVSYKRFRDSDELRDFVENDLALLLTERFVSVPDKGVRARRRTSVPAALDEFVGREPELGGLLDLLAGTTRLITVTGPGGVGKTRLATEAARRCDELFSSGVHFVGLSSVPEPRLVAPAILTALELPAGPTASVTDVLVDHLRDVELLLVLDNFEHVVDAAPDIGQLLEGCPGLRVLVSSRSVLRLRGEQEFPVEPLSLPDALRLFAERASRVTPGFEVTEANAAAVDEICRRLEGLPLAIELAAARMRTLPAESMLPHLERRLEFLTGGGRDYPERHRTLHATIDWSFALLEPADQELLERASVFRGGWDLASASAVCGGGDVLAGLESLLEKSLVGQQSVGAQPRFTMLESIREYAGDRLAAAGHESETRRRHADVYLDLVRAQGAALRSSAQAAALEQLDLEEDNVRAAMRFALEQVEPNRVAAAGWALMPFWWLRGAFDEAERWMNDALEGEGVDDIGRAEALLVLGFIAFWRWDFPKAMPFLTEASGIFASHGDEYRAAVARGQIAAAKAAAGDPTAVKTFHEIRSTLAAIGDEWGLMAATNGLCFALNVFELDAPIELFEEARQRASAVGTRAELATALGNLSLRKARGGDVAGAKTTLVETLGIVKALRSPTGVAYYVTVAAALAGREQDHAEAVRLFSAAAASWTAAGAAVPPHLAKLHEHALMAAEAALDPAALERARADGAALGAFEAADEAVTWLSSPEPPARAGPAGP
jgi:predicted ATPase